MQHYSRLFVLQRSHKLVISLYQTSQSFPSVEKFGLTAQLRRAVLSVPTNIAEGSKRKAPKDFAQFLNIAEASLSEAEYLVLVARDLGYIPMEIATGYLIETGELLRMLCSLRLKICKSHSVSLNSKNC